MWLSHILFGLDMVELGQGARTVAGATVSVGCVHFLLCVILIVYGITFFAHDVILKQIFMNLTYHVKIEL